MACCLTPLYFYDLSLGSGRLDFGGFVCRHDGDTSQDISCFLWVMKEYSLKRKHVNEKQCVEKQ